MTDEMKAIFEKFDLTEADEPAYELYKKFANIYTIECVLKMEQKLQGDNTDE